MLRDEPTIRPNLYRLPKEPLAEEILIPAFRQATTVRGAFGWFSAGWIQNLAHGLASFLARDDTRPIDFTVAPALFAAERHAVERAVLSAVDAARRIEDEVLRAARPDAGALSNHAVDCLTWMLATGRLELHIAIPVPGGNYHPKIWLFSDGSETVAVRGSANATGRAYGSSVEHMDVDCTWQGRSRVVAAEEMVDDWTAGRDPGLERTVPLPTAVRERLLRMAPANAPDEGAYQRALGTVLAKNAPAKQPAIPLRFAIPSGLEWRTGHFRHQGEAVAAWENSGRRGVLAMATGAGKTVTALISAYRTWQEHDGPFLLVISAPTKPLVAQWNSECERFGLRPVNPGPGTSAGRDSLGHTIQRLRSNHQTVPPCLVVTNDALTNDAFVETLRHARDSVPGLATMLIADEVHSLGTRRFLDNAPECADFRLGLSATPVRQYDEDGTGALLSYFGDTAYEFDLGRAIGVCLVPYDYHFDVVHLDHGELEEFRRLSERIGQRVAAAGIFDARDEALRALLIKRREILEDASAKVGALDALISSRQKVRHLLIYTTSKDPSQISSAAAILDRHGVAYARVTQAESKNRAKLSRILGAFTDGSIEVVLAKKVLDEGVNIPQAREAILLASSTVEREWIQRRGRVLRQAPGKTHATIRDIIALPPPATSRYEDSVLSAISRELDRVRAFGAYARNAAEVLAAIREVHRGYFD